MDEKMISYLDEQIKLLSGDSNKEKKDKTRNEIFIKMAPFIDRWIKGNLNFRQLYMEDDERLSLSWDCFEFCLRYYHPERHIQLPNHFYKYTNFFLLSWFAEKQKQDNQINGDASVEDNQKLDNCQIYYEQIDDLKQFRKMIPEDYKDIFDDALLSMTGRPADKIAYAKSDAYGYYKYCEAKKVFKIVIDFLLRR
jgi:hypothetical protein